MEFKAARDFLLTHRADYETAYRDFRWPRPETFNWALDWFDTIAAGNDRPALWIVDDDDIETRLSFAELSARSDALAGWLRDNGVRRGDRTLLMLGNRAAALGVHPRAHQAGRGDDPVERRCSRPRTSPTASSAVRWLMSSRSRQQTDRLRATSPARSRASRSAMRSTDGSSTTTS